MSAHKLYFDCMATVLGCILIVNEPHSGPQWRQVIYFFCDDYRGCGSHLRSSNVFHMSNSIRAKHALDHQFNDLVLVQLPWSFNAVADILSWSMNLYITVTTRARIRLIFLSNGHQAQKSQLNILIVFQDVHL